MTYLPDVNVWIALAVGEHVQHEAAKDWLAGCGNDSIAFCRVTQMGLLRLLTNSRVMAGHALSPMEAWRAVDAFHEDSRILLAGEPATVERQWRDLTRRSDTGPNFWTDAYLTAFAAAAGFTMVTFDKALRQHGGSLVRILG